MAFAWERMGRERLASLALPRGNEQGIAALLGEQARWPIGHSPPHAEVMLPRSALLSLALLLHTLRHAALSDRAPHSTRGPRVRPTTLPASCPGLLCCARTCWHWRSRHLRAQHVVRCRAEAQPARRRPAGNHPAAGAHPCPQQQHMSKLLGGAS